MASGHALSRSNRLAEPADAFNGLASRVSHRGGRGAETIGEVSLLCRRARHRLRDCLETAFIPLTAEGGREGCLPFAVDLPLLKTLLASLHRSDAALPQLGGALDEAERGLLLRLPGEVFGDVLGDLGAADLALVAERAVPGDVGPLRTEPPRVFRRLFGLSYAAIGMASSWE